MIMVFSLFPTCLNGNETKATGDTIVYICTGPKSKVYHKYKDCKGLSRCSRSIKAVKLSDVKESRRPCKICY